MNDKWLRLLGIPVVAVIMHVVFDGWPRQYDTAVLTHFLFGVFITVLLWEGNRALFLLMRRLFPHYDQTTRRLVVQTLSSTAFTFAATLFLNEFHRLLFGVPLCEKGELFSSFLLKMVPTLMVTSVYESIYFFGEWKKNLQRSEALARAGIQSELEALRSQLDPHFLFNSLNTLAALIEDDNEPAHTYLEQLADVYRYVLVSRDKTTVPLREEIAFVEAYLYLNKTRFRDDLQVEQRIAPAAYATNVAPLSLQMLVENAIKHNVISPENPLRVTLATEPDSGYVRVQNNVQPKTGLEQSTKVGLRNIINRYRLLSEHPVEVLRENGLFTVRLPLLS
ncbi:sensor histidine kinase [Hymenobacter weizhouensis]|uniref:sensor histidine kinase n=1 Tax=Hymenobacter sp. YIM 151500-1 TaxID=2987689 RepID=UPI002226DA3F|nr:histidine kinase [Hymenobacter sp. YIM 151500-1]UYZ64454.1 histidine kinase [Hymenobacter sp. YIM 151500-1]